MSSVRNKPAPGARPGPGRNTRPSLVGGGLAAALLATLAGCGQPSAQAEHPGRAVYLRYCFSCHQAGIAGAPKLGEREEWAARMAKGRDVMLANVKRGMAPGMPPRGACGACDDETLAVAVDYMVAELQGTP